MVNSNGQLEEDDLMGSQIGDSLSEFDLPPGQREREDALQRASLLTTSDEEENSGDKTPDEDEQHSPPGGSGHHNFQVAILRWVLPPVFHWEQNLVPAPAQARQGEHSTPRWD